VSVASDNRAELATNTVLAGCSEIEVEWHYIAPGKSMQNGHVEICFGRMRNKAVRHLSQLVESWGARQRPNH